MDKKLATITLGGGCFWCLDAAFRTVNGVEDVRCGYAGGESADPTYEEVCRGDSGHAEVVQITFDTAVLSVDRIFDIFWLLHDPTTLNRQGADVGTQYRSIILYLDTSELKKAQDSIHAAQSVFSSPIVTQIAQLKDFYEAEAYHQNYFANNPEKPYCQAVIAPKVQKLRDALKRENSSFN